MNRFFYKKWVRVCAVILCILSFNVMAGSFAAILLGQSAGVYDNAEEEVRKSIFDDISREYSVQAVVNNENDFDISELEDTNFRYGVIQGESLEGIDLNDKKNFEVCNFDQKVTEDMLYKYSCDVGKSTNFRVGNSLFDPSWLYNERTYQEERKTIEGCYFARDTGKFYMKAGDVFYTVDGYGEYKNAITLNSENYEIADAAADDEKSYVWQSPQDTVEISGSTYYMSDIPIVLKKDLSEMGKIVSNNAEDSNYEEYGVNDGNIVTYAYEFEKTKPYYVLSYVAEPLTAKNNFYHHNLFGKLTDFSSQDYFVQADFLIETAFALRYGVIWSFVIAFFLFLFSFAAALTGAGHRNSEKITAGAVEKIPLDVLIILVCIIVTGMLFAEAIAVDILGVTISISLGIFLAFLAEILSIIFCMSLAVRIKSGGWWKNTLCCRIGSALIKQIKRSVSKVSRTFPMIWKAWAVMAVLALLELFGISVNGYNPEVQVMLWFIEKIVVYGFLTICLLQMKKLKQAGEKLAAGEMDSRIDTSKMFWDLKQHGENLNNIREGIHQAVAEQMKSERFKTELITNVSHDIKTPLTSIINYVDLLEKEDIDNPTVQEYLEVLSRQSTRLKKLIEDLMEASKASTGNLAVAWENCDAQVMLTQTIGEFEEKLKANQIELLVQGSKEPVMLSADPRHLWRIFENLMNNICKYALPATRAYVNIEKQGNQGKIIFRNISKYALNIGSEELMERFVRGDSSRNTEGSGLGLSIAKSLTELMNGTFELVVDGDLFKVIVTFPLVSLQSESQV